MAHPNSNKNSGPDVSFSFFSATYYTSGLNRYFSYCSTFLPGYLYEEGAAPLIWGFSFGLFYLNLGVQLKLNLSVNLSV